MMGQGKGQQKTGQRALAAAERQRQALALRQAGADYRSIAAQLGFCNPGNAYRAVKAALRRAVERSAGAVRRLEASRLDRLLLAVWQRAVGGAATPADLDAVDRVLKIMARRAALLGLDAPARVKSELTGKDGSALAPHLVITCEGTPSMAGQKATEDRATGNRGDSP
jgi:hypothetical protein